MLNLLFLVAVSAAPAGCAAQPAAGLMALSYDAFDTASSESAWRTLLSRGCVEAAVATLRSYRSANGGWMTDEQKRELSFHIGQAYAFSGRERESIADFEAAAGPGSTPEWSSYVDATIAFIRKDRPRLERALTSYETIAKPSSMRLAVIRGLLRCFDRSYMEAAHCGM